MYRKQQCRGWVLPVPTVLTVNLLQMPRPWQERSSGTASASLTFSLENKSTWTGSFVQDESNAGNGGDGYANLTIDSSSTWIVDGDSTLSSLTCKGTITDEDGNTVTVKGSDGTTYVEGTSDYTITVSSYEA